jgi:5-methylcytosine-specific restriction endonuclease McrA
MNIIPVKKKRKQTEKDSIRKKRWYLENRERIRREAKKKYSQNKDVVLSRNREWVKNNRERVRSQKRIYVAKNYEVIREKARNHYLENAGAIKAKVAQWAKENPERLYRRVRDWQLNNPDKVKASTRKYNLSHRDEKRILSINRRSKIKGNGGKIEKSEWVALCKYYGNKCLCCGVSGVKLTIDHVVPIKLGGPNIIENAQPLCQSCNSKKHIKIMDYRK